jgi:hypothetical protein
VLSGAVAGLRDLARSTAVPAPSRRVSMALPDPGPDEDPLQHQQQQQQQQQSRRGGRAADGDAEVTGC